MFLPGAASRDLRYNLDLGRNAPDLGSNDLDLGSNDLDLVRIDLGRNDLDPVRIDLGRNDLEPVRIDLGCGAPWAACTAWSVRCGSHGLVRGCTWGPCTSLSYCASCSSIIINTGVNFKSTPCLTLMSMINYFTVLLCILTFVRRIS